MEDKKDQAQQPEQELGSNDPPEQQEGEQTKEGWGTLGGGLLALVGFHLQSEYRLSSRKHIGAARLVNRRWAAELPHGCSTLRVIGAGPACWERMYHGLETLTWWNPEHASQSWGQSCPNLRDLVLHHGDDEILRTLRSLPGLASLSLIDNKKITEEGFKELKHLPALSELQVEGCQETPHEVLKEVTNLSALKSLRLSCCGRSAASTEVPQKEKEFEHPSLHLRCCSHRLSHMPLKELKHMSSLTSANLIKSGSRTYVADDILKELSQLPSLTSLKLTSLNITDEGLKAIRHHTALTSLQLKSCERISHEGVKQLAHLSALTYLDLSKCPRIKDETLRELTRLSALTELNLLGCREIKYGGLLELKHMTALIFLDLPDLSEGGDEALEGNNFIMYLV